MIRDIQFIRCKHEKTYKSDGLATHFVHLRDFQKLTAKNQSRSDIKVRYKSFSQSISIRIITIQQMKDDITI